MSDIGEEPVHLLWLSQAPETLQGPRAFQGSGGGAVPSPGVGGAWQSPEVPRHRPWWPLARGCSSPRCLQTSAHSTLQRMRRLKIWSGRTDHPPLPTPSTPGLWLWAWLSAFPWRTVSESAVQLPSSSAPPVPPHPSLHLSPALLTPEGPGGRDPACAQFCGENRP